MDIDYHRNEDEYFLKQDAEKRRRLKQQFETSARSTAGRSLADALSAGGDEAITQRAAELGFTPETAPVLHLVPLVHVAWADGAVSAQERLTILRAAEAHGAGPGSAGSLFLASLLEEKPDDAWLTQTEDLVRAIARHRGSDAGNIVDLCRDVADATGGFLGIGSRISESERKLIEQFERTLKPAADRATRTMTGS